MSEPPASPSSTPSTDPSTNPSKWVDAFLYASAAVTYVSLAIYNKWLLNWVIGPLWLVAWVWGLPALWKLVRRQPVRPAHTRRRPQ
jgi:hypothetical protein